MKVLLFIGILSTSLIQAPRKVLSSFDRKYRSAECVVWTPVGNEYHASFEHFDQQKTAIFKYNGEWVKTLVHLDAKKLMFCIRDYIKYSYPEARIHSAYYVVNPNLCEYHVYLERGEGEELCLEEEPLIFDENCEFLRNPNFQ